MSRKTSHKNKRTTDDDFGSSIKLYPKTNEETGKYETFASSTNSNSYIKFTRNEMTDNISYRNKGIIAKLVKLAKYIYFLKYSFSLP